MKHDPLLVGLPATLSPPRRHSPSDGMRLNVKPNVY